MKNKRQKYFVRPGLEENPIDTKQPAAPHEIITAAVYIPCTNREDGQFLQAIELREYAARPGMAGGGILRAKEQGDQQTRLSSVDV